MAKIRTAKELETVCAKIVIIAVTFPYIRNLCIILQKLHRYMFPVTTKLS